MRRGERNYAACDCYVQGGDGMLRTLDKQYIVKEVREYHRALGCKLRQSCPYCQSMSALTDPLMQVNSEDQASLVKLTKAYCARILDATEVRNEFNCNENTEKCLPSYCSFQMYELMRLFSRFLHPLGVCVSLFRLLQDANTFLVRIFAHVHVIERQQDFLVMQVSAVCTLTQNGKKKEEKTVPCVLAGGTQLACF